MFPPSNATHNADQVFFYDADFMLRRTDYSPDVTGNPPVAHYTSDPVTFDGFVFPTRRRMHLRDADGVADQSLAVITDDVSEVRRRTAGYGCTSITPLSSVSCDDPPTYTGTRPDGVTQCWAPVSQ
jgi:hypothetical protein